MRSIEMKFTKSDRQARIVVELRTAPTLRVNELAALLDVSTETVRRDLAELDERGLINRTYSGATRPVSFEPALVEREKMMVAERERIAAAAVTLVEANDILMIGGGATATIFARRLATDPTPSRRCSATAPARPSSAPAASPQKGPAMPVWAPASSMAR
jgi:DeoR/GlpR family transcriptional regulator of sugar metabolism